MDIESDDEFVALLRKRFADKPYSGDHSKIPGYTEYWTDERYEALIQELLVTQHTIREASREAPWRGDEMNAADLDLATAKWAIWSICTHDVGATPTSWHRIWSALRTVITWTRYDERRRIGEALAAEHAQSVGPTAANLIAQAIIADADD